MWLVSCVRPLLISVIFHPLLPPILFIRLFFFPQNNLLLRRVGRCGSSSFGCGCSWFAIILGHGSKINPDADSSIWRKFDECSFTVSLISQPRFFWNFWSVFLPRMVSFRLSPAACQSSSIFVVISRFKIIFSLSLFFSFLEKKTPF